MGVPRQEFFLEEQWTGLGVNLAIGVGGSFEVLAGIRRRARIGSSGPGWSGSGVSCRSPAASDHATSTPTPGSSAMSWASSSGTDPSEAARVSPAVHRRSHDHPRHPPRGDQARALSSSRRSVRPTSSISWWSRQGSIGRCSTRCSGYFEIRPDVDLDIMSHDQDLRQVTTQALNGLYDVLGDHRPVRRVRRDTTTAFAGALAAFYHQLPVAHVEAGSRCARPVLGRFRRKSIAADQSHRRIPFRPTESAKCNLLAEGIDEVRICGDREHAIDALLTTLPALSRRHAYQNGRTLLVTAHGEPRRPDAADLPGRAAAPRDVPRPSGRLPRAPRVPACRQIVLPLLSVIPRIARLQPSTTGLCPRDGRCLADPYRLRRMSRKRRRLSTSLSWSFVGRPSAWRPSKLAPRVSSEPMTTRW